MPTRTGEPIDYSKPFSKARWFDVLPRTACCPALSERVLLHAGPPFRGAPPAPVMNGAIQALLFEGLASSDAAARDLLLGGGAELRPAQDYGVVTPLAQVVSASMLLVAVEQRPHISYAPLVESSAPALRFGSADPECLRRLRDMGAWIAVRVAPLVRREPLAIDEVIRAAISAGEECHAGTAAANEAMVSSLRGLDAGGAARLRAIPAFVLPVLMAAAAAAMRTCRCEIEAIGGNGIDFGVRTPRPSGMASIAGGCAPRSALRRDGGGKPIGCDRRQRGDRFLRVGRAGTRGGAETRGRMAGGRCPPMPSRGVMNSSIRIAASSIPRASCVAAHRR